jgi:hypothetical protein
MAYLPSTTQKITFDTDNRRPDSHPSIIVGPTGQQMIFYTKFLTTGKSSFSRITFTAPSFIVNIEAGSGTINGSSVTWGAGTLTASPNIYQVVYSDNVGILHIANILTMAQAATLIVLAYVQSGNSSITRIEEVEHTGYYVYIRKQILSGSNWVWDDYEYRLNTGEEPEAYYDVSTNKIYLSYKKDSISYIRMFDPTNELTWDYLPNINISVSNITLNNDPENSVVVALSAGYTSYNLLTSNEYPLSNPDFCFINNLPYIILPDITGINLPYAYGEVTYDLLTYNSGIYTVEATYTIPHINAYYLAYRVVPWVGAVGLKYLRCTVHTRLFTIPFVTDPVNYQQIYIFSFPALITLADNIYNVTAKDNSLVNAIASGYQISLLKTAEYEETKTFQSDNSLTNAVASGYQISLLKTAEYEETKTFQSDNSLTNAIASGYKVYITITNT